MKPKPLALPLAFTLALVLVSPSPRSLGAAEKAPTPGTPATVLVKAGGVASIEHGSLIDEEGIRMMKERGTYLVADVYNDDWIMKGGEVVVSR